MDNFNKSISNLNFTQMENDEFIIPYFQRKYRWTEKEINELFQDIENAFIQKNKNYYLNEIILGCLITNRKEFYIIDGQQRFTTLYLFFKIFSEEFYEEKDVFKDFLNRKILKRTDRKGYAIENEDKLIYENKNGDRINYLDYYKKDKDIQNAENEIRKIIKRFYEKYKEEFETKMIDFILELNFDSKKISSVYREVTKKELFEYCLEYFEKINIRGLKFSEEDIKILKENLNNKDNKFLKPKNK